MEMLILALLLAINTAISWWNCYVVGSVWDWTREEGFFFRLLLWSAAVQSVVGFSMLFLFGGIYGLKWLEYVDPATTSKVAKLAVSYWYVAVIIPLLSTGMIITVYSWAEAIKRRDFASIATTGWNTFAQANNMYGAYRNMGGMMNTAGEGIGDLFSGGDSDDLKAKVALLGLLLAIAALIGGIVTTVVLINRYRKIGFADYMAEARTVGSSHRAARA